MCKCVSIYLSIYIYIYIYIYINKIYGPHILVSVFIMYCKQNLEGDGHEIKVSYMTYSFFATQLHHRLISIIHAAPPVLENC